MATHSRLAPSASERWINCPASVAMNEQFPDTTSPYAAEGTVAHKLGELKLRNLFLSELGGKPTDKEWTEVYESEFYNKDMEDFTDEYVSYINSVLNGGTFSMLIETKLNLDFITPETSGIADCILVEGDHLHVIDLKYGKNVEVDAKDNPQLKIYGLGACKLFDGLIYNIKDVTVHIVQPRMNNFSSMTLTKEELNQWLDGVVKPQATKAVNNSLEVKSGDWCKFCKAKAICREYDKQFDYSLTPTHPQFLSNSEIADRINKLSEIPAHLKELKEYTLNHIMDGEEFPGYKAVAGRSTRIWKDQQKAFEIAIANGYDRSILYTQEPLSLAKVEKLMGKKTFENLLSDYVDKPTGKPTLVKESDPRESIVNTNTALEDFKDIKI